MSKRQVAINCATLALSLAPIPAAAGLAVILQEIYTIVEQVQRKKEECRSLADVSLYVLEELGKRARQLEGTEMESTWKALQEKLLQIQDDLERWSQHSRWKAFWQNTKVLTRIEEHKNELDAMLTTATVSFAAENYVTVVNIEARAEDLNNKMDSCLEILRKGASHSESVIREARKQIWKCRMNEVDILRPDLSYEVEVKEDRPFHEGHTYNIYKGSWLDEVTVALKVLRGTSYTPKQTVRMARQIALWRSINHPNVLRLHGWAELHDNDTKDLCIVIPYMANRDLNVYLDRKPNANRLRLMIDMLEGLKYLHSMKIMHGGLFASNVLVDFNGTAVLSDFTLSKIVEEGVLFTASSCIGPIRWMAPETQDRNAITCQSDVYAWAMTSLEILSGKEPFYTMKSPVTIMKAVLWERQTPNRSEYESPHLTDEIWELLTPCWAWEPNDRPTVDVLLSQCKALKATTGRSGSGASSIVGRTSSSETLTP
ncbi:hypothetical protein FRC02_004019 [Tulasnella sp. 418]|nr:hypothetical protein FRC02_004019 [Tulasnella sp. 418]